MHPEHARPGTSVDEFWDDDDTGADYYTPLRAQPEPIEPAPSPRPRRLDTNWWDEDTQDALWDTAESAPPAHAPIRAVDGASIGAWSPVLEHRPPWYRTRPAAIALIIAAAGITTVVLAIESPAADEQDSPSITPTRPSVATIEPAPRATPTPSAVAPPPPPAPPSPLPPPPAEQINPPSGGGSGYQPRPRTATPQQTDKPRIDVTRAPMSVAPEPRTPPKTSAPGGNSSGGGWPW